MSAVQVLIEEICKSRQALAKIENFYDQVATPLTAETRTQEKALVVADLLAKHYTCLETVFLRISQFFENNLSRHRWHADLLDKMTLRIDGVREAVIRDQTRDTLLELLKFRHFTRYYYDIAYDWDRLDYLMKKFAETRARLSNDLNAFEQFLKQLNAQDGEAAPCV